MEPMISRNFLHLEIWLVIMGKTDLSHVVADAISLHTHTLIMLHGRGSKANRFANDLSNPDKPGFLCSRTSTGLTL